jgi:hypothetical protein
MWKRKAALLALVTISVCIGTTAVVAQQGSGGVTLSEPITVGFILLLAGQLAAWLKFAWDWKHQKRREREEFEEDVKDIIAEARESDGFKRAVTREVREFTGSAEYLDRKDRRMNEVAETVVHRRIETGDFVRRAEMEEHKRNEDRRFEEITDRLNQIIPTITETVRVSVEAGMARALRERNAAEADDTARRRR